MGAHVPVQVGHVGEAFAANLAGECALPLVDGRDVALIFVTFVKTLVAYLNEELVVFGPFIHSYRTCIKFKTNSSE
jgi:hypothetical protein